MPTFTSYRLGSHYLPSGGYSLTYMDEFVDELLNEERVCDIILPRITKREVLEDTGEIGPRKSRLLDAMEGKEEDEKSRSRSRSRSSSRTKSPARSVSPDRSPGAARSRSGSVASDAGSRYLSRSHSQSPALSYRSRSRSISPDRLNGNENGGSPRYRSRSRSISPDRMETTD